MVLTASGSVIAKDAAQTLGLSEDTIRRDLRDLAKAGLLRRVHGGAVSIAPANAPYPRRVDIANPEKIAIGKRAARMIAPGAVVFVDGGTTALQLVRHLPRSLRATIITHSPNIAMELLDHPDLEVEIIGGRLFRHSIVTCGAATIAWLDRYRPDICFIGVTGLHPQSGITTGNSEEAEVKRAVIVRSGAAILLASSEKLGAVAAFEVARWTDIDGIIVPASAHAKAQTMFAPLGCEVFCGDDG